MVMESCMGWLRIIPAIIFGDWDFYDNGTPVFRVYNALGRAGVAFDAYMSGTTLQVGVEGNSLPCMEM